jgi:hypothetical protein
LSKSDFGKPNENHDFTGALKYVPEREIKAGQILAPVGFRPPFLRMLPAGPDTIGLLVVAKHDVNPKLGHRVGIATPWAVFERVDTKGASLGSPIYLTADGTWTLESIGGRQIGQVLGDSTILLSPGDYAPVARVQPESSTNQEPETPATKGGQKQGPPRK